MVMKKYILNDRVMFIPDENKLSPLGARGPEVVLNAPVSRFLVLLLKKNGSVAPQDEILREVWEKHGQVVTLNTLYQNVSLLRKALKKTGMVTSAVRTHSKVGFSFRGNVQVIELDDIPEAGAGIPVISQNVSSLPIQDRTILPDEANLPGNEFNPNSDKINSVPLLRKKRIVYLVVCFIVAAIMTVVVTREHFVSDTFSVHHRIIARVNQCPLYIDKGNQKIDLTRITSYLKDKGVTCSQEEFLYLTKNINREDLLLFVCTPGTEEDLKCVTTIKIPSYLYPK